MSKKRAVIVFADGAVNLADSASGKHPHYRGTAFNLDDALQKGAKLVGDPIPMGSPPGSAVLLIVDEEPTKPSEVQ